MLLALLPLVLALPCRAEIISTVGECQQTAPYGPSIAACTVEIDNPARSVAERAAAYRLRGMMRGFQDDLPGAIEDYGRTLELDPSDWVAFRFRAEARATTGDLAGAVSDADRLVELRPDNGDALLTRAHVLRLAGDYERSRADANAAKDVDGNLLEEAIVARAEACFEQYLRERSASPCNWFDATIDITLVLGGDNAEDTVAAEAWALQARIMEDQGQLEQARDAYTQAADLDPFEDEYVRQGNRIGDLLN
jgi:tetratricopeptide (TPR) repeat protein